MRTTFAALALAVALPAQASLVTTYDSMTGHEWGSAGVIGGFDPNDWTVGHSWRVGQRFTAQADGYIASLALAAYHLSSFTIDLYADAGGQLGAKLATLALNSPGGGSYGTPATATYDSGFGLSAGGSYWLLLGDDLGAEYENWWYMASPGPAGNRTVQGHAAGNQNPTSFQYYDEDRALGAVIGIETGSVPEPSGVALAGLALAGLAFARRRVSSPSKAT